MFSLKDNEITRSNRENIISAGLPGKISLLLIQSWLTGFMQRLSWFLFDLTTVCRTDCVASSDLLRKIKNNLDVNTMFSLG